MYSIRSTWGKHQCELKFEVEDGRLLTPNLWQTEAQMFLHIVWNNARSSVYSFVKMLESLLFITQRAQQPTSTL